uniref:PWI domain-containing protein n=1 Tax=Mola mola TaxID=94237 RepID=A0A3Q3W3H8_MOLML
MDAGFFRGTSAEQDNRFSNKQKKLLKQLKFAECLDKKVDMTKVNLEVIKPWITQRVTEILGFEDDVVIEFIFNQLEEKVIILMKNVHIILSFHKKYSICVL